MLWLFVSIFTGCHFHGHKYFLLAVSRICACWPSGLYSGLPDYGQEIDPALSTFFFSHVFAHELFMSAYSYAVRGKRVKVSEAYTGIYEY